MFITESSAKAARDAISYTDPGDNKLKLMRLNSIAQSIATGDSILAAALIRQSCFPSDLLAIVEGKPVLKDPQAFEELFAEATRAHPQVALDEGKAHPHAQPGMTHPRLRMAMQQGHIR